MFRWSHCGIRVEHVQYLGLRGIKMPAKLLLLYNKWWKLFRFSSDPQCLLQKELNSPLYLSDGIIQKLVCYRSDFLRKTPVGIDGYISLLGYYRVLNAGLKGQITKVINR